MKTISRIATVLALLASIIPVYAVMDIDRIRSQWRWKSVNNTRHPDTYIGWPFDGYREAREEITKVCHYLFYNKPLSFGSCLCRHIDINMVIHHLLINR